MYKRKLTLTAAFLVLCFHGTAASRSKPTGLKCDSLIEPLGIDSPKPLLSWKLQDASWGAAQTAYQILVGSKPNAADVWDSGRIASNQSVNVPYAGSALEAQKRYYWVVKVWDKDSKPYPASDVSWFETGLLAATNWKAKWIGYEEEEQRRIREANAAWITNSEVADFSGTADARHDFRLRFDVAKPVKRAVLYVTGQDAAAAWINGRQALEAAPLPKWQQMPWQTYTRQDVTSELREGGNVLAVGITHYFIGGTTVTPRVSRTPMSACLLIESVDGSSELITSSAPDWKAALNAEGDWFAHAYDDSAWKPAEKFTPREGFNAAAVGNPCPTGPVMILRRTFEVTKPVTSARLYATALGAYKFHLNGSGVGDQILSPGWMDFRQHVPYQVYDVTAQVKDGPNGIAAYLAPGWYTTPLMWFRQGYNYGNTPPALKAQLRLEHADGSVDWVITDESWKADVSPMLMAEIYDGETYDARRVQPGWDTASFADAAWKPASIVTPKEPEIVSQYFQPIREEKVMAAKSVSSPSPGVYIYDFGQNLAGVPRISLQGPRGTDVKLRFAEVLNTDGTIYVENLRTAKATDHFILAGTGIEEYQPQFTFHGFRYMEISGVAAQPGIADVKAVVLHTAAPFTAELQTGSPMVNQLWSNILWGQRSNFVGVPTDCPQRDERLGWTADAQVFWRTASFDMDLDNFTLKYSADLRGTQSGTPMYGIFAPGTSSPSPGFGAGWSDAGVIIPWTGWLQTGDKRIIDQNWEAMEKYLSAIQQANPDYLWRNQFGIPFGDWLTPTQTTPEDLIATAYWAYDVSLMRDMAAASGRTADARKYGELFDNIKAAFMKAYVRADGFVGAADLYPSIPPPTVHPVKQTAETKAIPVETQTGYVLALHMNLLPEGLRAVAASKLVRKIEDNHWLLGTGFLGTPYLLEVLSDTGHSDVAYRLLLNTTYPSWGYLIEHGATTTWERWNGDEMRGDPSMNSYNHYAYGAVGEWIYRYAAGIDAVASDAGFHTVYLHPNFDSRLGNVDFAYESAYGRIASEWTVSGAQANWHVTVPPNAKGQLRLSAAEAAAFRVAGVPLPRSKKVRARGDNVYELPAGTYSFVVKLKAPAATEGSAGAVLTKTAAKPIYWKGE